MNFYSSHLYLGVMVYQIISTHMALCRGCGRPHLHLVHFLGHQSAVICTIQSVFVKQFYSLSYCIWLSLQSFWLHSCWRKNLNRTRNWMHLNHCYGITNDYSMKNRKFFFSFCFHWTSNLFIDLNILIVSFRKYGSALSTDQSRTCSLSDVMVCNGLNHKNCNSWSRLVELVLNFMKIKSQNADQYFDFLNFEYSRCEQDGLLSRNGSYYGSCVEGIPQRVPCTVERETIAWNVM